DRKPHQRDILPLRKIISDETLLRYNGMLVDVFTLLTEARQRMLSTIKAIEAKRDFWIARTGLQVAIVGGGGGASQAEEKSRAASVANTGADSLTGNSNGARP